MVSQTAEHALRAVLYLARQPRGALVSAEAMADHLEAPRNYLSKTLNVLAKQGLLASARGPAGGFRLVADPSTLTIAEVVRVFDSARGEMVCLLEGRRCPGSERCAAHVRWRAVVDAAREPMRSTTIGDLLAARG